MNCCSQFASSWQSFALSQVNIGTKHLRMFQSQKALRTHLNAPVDLAVSATWAQLHMFYSWLCVLLFFIHTETNRNFISTFRFFLAFVILLDSRIEAPCLIWVNVSIVLVWTTLLIFGEFILMELGKLKRDTFVPIVDFTSMFRFFY